MINETTHIIVNVAFGACFGAVVALQAIIAPEMRSSSERAPRREGQSFAGYLKEQAMSRAAESRREVDLSPQMRLIALAMWGLVATMVAAMTLSPIAMRWWWFVGALFVVALIIQLMHRESRRRLIRLRERERSPASQ